VIDWFRKIVSRSLFLNLVIGVKRDGFLSGLGLAWIFSSDFDCLIVL